MLWRRSCGHAGFSLGELARPQENPHRQASEYREVVAGLGQQAEERAPGGLELLDAYQRTATRGTPWRPLNTGAIAYATDTNPHRKQ